MTREPAAIARRIQEALETAKLSFALAGAVLFGSSATARAAAHSDVDLLVVGRGLPLKRQRRCREIVELKQWLPGVPLDVLLLTPEEVESNFRNHNPLFLDIAEDGVVLLDREGILARAIEATRRHVRERGIVRTDQGWRFPVEVGRPTLLSRVSNRDFAWGMLRDAERDRRIGERLSEDGFYDKAVSHFQPAVEKAVKAVLIGLGIVLKTHLVGAVLREVTLGEKPVPAQSEGSAPGGGRSLGGARAGGEPQSVSRHHRRCPLAPERRVWAGRCRSGWGEGGQGVGGCRGICQGLVC